MVYLQDAICEFSGVCPPIIPPTTTTVPPPTQPPPTQNPNILESSTQQNASFSPKIPPNPNSNLTDYVETDFEEPNDFKVEVEYELDERELEVYFERDKFNGSGGIKKDDAANTVVIVCIFVGVLICLSAIGAGGFFYMMRKNNNNQGGQVMVVR
ncbi:hypothetical protein L5515_010147 [Caenorhabditis briggsae]|uniref:Uncharacterized protein n=1 Tax=Caenorhabditis briggsae TaxID=6238 RepID=A0AAE9JFJ7_CAEBR|nr:hypothetical protein L5515_010147 [Caenorhabditis briggsae]